MKIQKNYFGKLFELWNEALRDPESDCGELKTSQIFNSVGHGETLPQSHHFKCPVALNLMKTDCFQVYLSLQCSFKDKKRTHMSPEKRVVIAIRTKISDGPLHFWKKVFPPNHCSEISVK